MRQRYSNRTGAVIVEFAICLPVLVLLTWGTIESSNAIFLKQTLTSAAHEGALAGMRSGATEATVRDSVELILKSRKLEDCRITITPPGNQLELLKSGESFSINIAKSNQGSFFKLASISVNVSSQRP